MAFLFQRKHLNYPMVKELFNKLLKKTGKTYTVDPRIPDSLILYNLSRRSWMRLRGIIWYQRKIFIGGHCTILNKRNIVFGKNVTIDHNTVIDGYASEKLIFGDNVKIGDHSLVTCTSHLSKYGKGLKIGNNSAVGRFTEFGASGGIEIGNDVIMGAYISLHSENHNYGDPTKLIREQGVTSAGIKIGNNVWVGAKATFLDGCVVGSNSVVAAGAVVTGVFPDNSIIGGVPAKILKKLD
jgi:acetyltransferase-like isoleucine patch superfamily enzyme